MDMTYFKLILKLCTCSLNSMEILSSVPEEGMKDAMVTVKEFIFACKLAWDCKVTYTWYTHLSSCLVKYSQHCYAVSF